MLLRDSCSLGPQSVIAWQSAPSEAYKLLVRQYSHSPEIQRDSLYREYHSLSFSEYTGLLADFNARYNNLVARLTLSGLIIQPIDQVNQYLKALEKVFPQWAERLRSTIRTIKAIRQSTKALNLQYLMTDILKEQRNPASTTAKGAAYKAQKAQKVAKKC